jgi:hypothetical protein
MRRTTPVIHNWLVRDTPVKAMAPVSRLAANNNNSSNDVAQGCSLSLPIEDDGLNRIPQIMLPKLYASKPRSQEAITSEIYHSLKAYLVVRMQLHSNYFITGLPPPSLLRPFLCLDFNGDFQTVGLVQYNLAPI